MFRCATFEAINISQKPTKGYAWIHRNVFSEPTGEIWLSSILQTCQKNVIIIYSPNLLEKSQYCLFSKLVREIWLSPIPQTYQRDLTTTYSPNLLEKPDYHLFLKLVRKTWLSPIFQSCQKNLTAVYSPSKAERADSVFHNFGEEDDREKSDGAFGSERFVAEASGRRVWSYVSRAPSNYLDLNPERADGVAISTHSSAVTLNGFRVLNASGEAIPFHRWKISIYPCRRRKHAKSRETPTTRKKKLHRNPAELDIYTSDYSAHETDSRGDEKDPVYRVYHLFKRHRRHTIRIVRLLSEKSMLAEEPNVRIIDIDRVARFVSLRLQIIARYLNESE